MTVEELRAEVARLQRELETQAEENRRAENALKVSEEKYQVVFDSLDEGFCIIEVIFSPEGKPVDYRFLETNRGFERQTGMADVIGRCMRELEPTYEADWFEIYGKVVTTRKAIRFEREAAALGCFYDLYAFPIGAPEERRVAVLFQDISQRHAHERQQKFLLKLSDALRPLSGALEIKQAAMRVVGRILKADRVLYADVMPDGNTVIIADNHVRKGFPKMTGHVDANDFGVTDINKLRGGEVLIIPDVEAATELTEAAKTAYQVFNIRTVVAVPLIKNGRWVSNFVLHHGSPRQWREYEIAILREAADRTWAAVEQAQAEEALRSSEERLSVALQAAQMATWDYDVTTNEVLWNDQHFRLLGLPIGENVRQPEDFLRELHPDDSAFVREALRRAIEETGIYRADFRIIRVDTGEIRWMSGFGQATQFTGGRATRMIGVMSDITESKHTEAALKAAKEESEAGSRAKDDFLAALSHELRNPLNPVLLCASDLAQDPALPGEVRNHLRMIHRNIELEARLIDDLLDLTRIARGKMQMHRTASDAHSLLRHTEEIVRVDAAAAGVDLRFILEAEESQVFADAARLQQVFWNLIKNAIKFSSATGVGRVNVRTFNPAPGRLTVEVQDNGVGITPAALAKIFRPFEQGDHGGHRFGGLGLGLAIAKRVVDLHDGKLSAASAGPRQGSTFTVEIASITEPASQKPRRAEPALPLRPLHLLLVEDHEPTLMVLARVLKRDGHRIHTARNAQEAQDFAASEGNCDLVISDIGLPDLSGIDLMRDLRARRGWRGIALSGYGMESDVRASLAAGFLIHLVKPLNIESLRGAIREAMTVEDGLEA